MAKYKTIGDLKAAVPMMGADNPSKIYNNVFCLFCHELLGNEYACWAAIQQFKHAPKKRTVIFIVDNWLKVSSAAVGMTVNQSILDPINTGSSEAKFTPQDRTALEVRIGKIKSVKTWTGKILNVFGEKGMGDISSDMLDGVEDLIEKNLNATLKDNNLQIDTSANIQGSPYYADSIITDRPQLQALTFDTKAMGIW